MQTTPTFSSAEALEAIHARVQGIFDNPQLLRLGPLDDTLRDITRIVSATSPDALAPTEAPVIAIMVSGGLVAGVHCSDPRLATASAVIVDTDIDGFDEDQVHEIVVNGDKINAGLAYEPIRTATFSGVNLGLVDAKPASSAYAAGQTPAFGIILEGGLVNAVVSNDEAYVGTPFVVVDYDTDGADADELLTVPQHDGTLVEAVGRFDTISSALIPLDKVTLGSAEDSDDFRPTPYQLALLKSYPGIDLMPFDPSDFNEVNDMVRRHETGDTLFDYLWQDLGDLGAGERLDALARLVGATRDIEEVKRAILKIH